MGREGGGDSERTARLGGRRGRGRGLAACGRRGGGERRRARSSPSCAGRQRLGRPSLSLPAGPELYPSLHAIAATGPSESGHPSPSAAEGRGRRARSGVGGQKKLTVHFEVDRIRTCAPRGHFLGCTVVKVAGKHLNHLITTPLIVETRFARGGVYLIKTAGEG